LAAIYGGTAGIGFAIGGGTSLAVSGSTKLFGSTAGVWTGSTIKAGTLGAGAYFGGTYLYGRGKQF